MPLTGGTPRPFLATGNSTPSWSPDNAQLVYIDADDGRRSAVSRRPHGRGRPSHRPCLTKARKRFSGKACTHTIRCGHRTANGSTSCTGRDPTGRMDVWRMQPVRRIAGAAHTPARSREFSGAARSAHAALCGARGGLVRTVAVGARRGEQGHAPRDRRASSNTRRCRPAGTAVAWSRPWPTPRPACGACHCSIGCVEDRDAQPYPVPTERALAPRFGGTSLFYLSLSTRGTGDGLWRVQNGQAFEVRKGADGVLSEPAGGVAGRQPRGGRRQTAGETAPRSHVGRRHQLTNPGCVHRHPRRRRARRR